MAMAPQEATLVISARAPAAVVRRQSGQLAPHARGRFQAGVGSLERATLAVRIGAADRASLASIQAFALGSDDKRLARDAQIQPSAAATAAAQNTAAKPRWALSQPPATPPTTPDRP